MPTTQGFSTGSLLPLGHIIVPAQQFPLSQTILGINNFQTGVIYNEAHLAQPVDCTLHSFTVTAFGVAPAAGALTLSAKTVDGVRFAATLDASTLTVATAAPQQIYLAPEPPPSIVAGVDITIVGDSTNYVQASGGLCIALWGLAVG